MRLPQDRILHIDTEIKDGKVNIVAEWQGELVRCKDCRHAYYADNRVPHDRTWVCERFMNEEINANDFCSWGERREK